MRTALIVSLIVSWIAGAALAQTSSPPLKSPDSAAPAASGRGDTAAKRLENSEGEATEALASCLEMWDAATHMTRRQWGRACRRVAERLKGLSLK